MSRVISGGQGEGCRRWDVPDLADSATGLANGGAGLDSRGLSGCTSEADLETVRHMAREEAYDLGYREGLEAGRQAQASRLEHLDRLMQTLTHPLAELDKEVEADLVELAIAIARQLLRDEYEVAPERIAAVVRDAIGLLPSAARVVRLRLHPDDAMLVREIVQLPEAVNDWHVVDDPSISRGGCVVDTETVRIDATVEARLESVLAALRSNESAEGGGI
jgi:flagellar assembly protein FliH